MKRHVAVITLAVGICCRASAQIWGPVYQTCTPASNNVGIGAFCPAATNARLGVRADNLERAVSALNYTNLSASTGTAAFEGSVIGTGSNMFIRAANIGLAINPGASSTISDGGYFVIEGSGGNITTACGVNGLVKQSGTGTVGTAFGLRGEAQKGNLRYGVFGKAAMLQSPPVSNWSSVTSWAGYFDGHVQVVGSFTSGSDRRLKKQIRPIEHALSLIDRLSAKRYYFDRAAHPNMELPFEEQFGLIAQEVAEVLPNLVSQVTHPRVYDEVGSVRHEAEEYLSMNYLGLIPILLAGVQEQQAIIEDKQTQLNDKQSQIDALTARLDKLEAAMISEGKRGEVAPGMGKPALFQNTPNPFNENTVIRYSLPEQCGKCVIEVMDASGRVVSTFSNLAAGQGQLMIAAGALSAGSYTYTLIVEGERMDSKSMVITR